MTAQPDIDRLISAFLEEGTAELPDRTYDVVRSEIDRTRQRVVIGPWRAPDMNTIAKFAIAAAAVVVVAVAGINLMPRNDVGAPAPSPSASPSVSPTQATSPQAAETFPPDGPLAIGRYGMTTMEGVRLSFAVPASGWSSHVPGNSIGKGPFGKPDGAGINFWPSAPDNVYSDPCAHTPLNPPAGGSASSLAAAAATIPGTDRVSGPTSIQVGGRGAQHVVVKIREDLGCDPDLAYLWYDDRTGGATGGWRWASALGSTHRVWIIDVDGQLVWIDSETFKGGGPEIEQEIQQIIDSIQFK
jgi:hypothetical protein